MIMKLFQFLSIVVLLVSGTFVMSCQKVIDINLNKKDPKIVIEANFNAGETISRVMVTKTLNFNEDAPYPTVDNAIVSVTDNLGNTQILTGIGNGLYQTNAYPIVENRTYTLTVTVDGNTYVASSTVPTAVQIDTLMVLDIPFAADTFHTLLPLRLDPAGVANYYQFDLFRNGKRLPGIYLQDDQFTDGIEIQEPIFDNDGAYVPGDTAVVNMYCIDQPVYNYFFALGENQNTTPANPTTNFSGGCLGYFSARTVSTAAVIIP
jgi:hypothetical protein